MDILIKVETNSSGIQTVNARDLHEFLEVKTKFADWISRRIEEYSFIEGKDFITLLKKENRQTLKEYHLSINMAKELSMVEHNEKGKQARKYFLECERRAKDPMVFLNDPAALRNALLTYSEKVIELENRVKSQKVTVNAFNRIAYADGSMCITDAAKHLQARPSDLFRYLEANKWIYKRSGNNHYIGYQEKIQQGLLLHKVTLMSYGDGTERVREQVRLTSKGITKLSQTVEDLIKKQK